MNSCLTFEDQNANSLPYLRPNRVAPAGQMWIMPTSPMSAAQWLSWLQPQRLAYVRSMTPRAQGESVDAYNARIRQIAVGMTTRAIASSNAPIRSAGRPALQVNRNAGQIPNVRIVHRAAGQLWDGISDFAGSGGSSGSGSDYNNPGTGSEYGSSSGLTDAQVQSIAQGAAAIIGVAGSLIAAAIQSGNATERARIDAEVRTHLADLQSQMQQSTNAAERQAAASQIEILQSTHSALTSDQSDKTMLYVVAGLGVLALGIAAFAVMRSRRNPTIYVRTKRGMRPSHYVPARKVK